MKTQTFQATSTITKETFHECKVCLFTEDVVKIHNDGICEMCKLHYQQRDQAREPWPKVLERIKKKGKGRKYDALVGISGGEDSSVLLYNAVKVWGLRVLAFHINNRTNRPQANNNIRILRDNLDINFYEYYPAADEYNKLTDSMLDSGTPDADIANDVHMAKLTFKLAKDNDIKCTLNGHSFREEGSSPKAWSFLDTTYLLDIYKKFTGKDLQYYEVLTLWDQVHAGLTGMLRVSPYHYEGHNRAHVLTTLKSWGWQSYGSKHNENIYTAYVGCQLLPNKFHIDKRITYLSAAIREGKMTKEYAKEILSTPMEFDVNDLGERKAHILHLADNARIRDRSEFKQTNYKRIKPLLWLLVKFGVFPLSAYKKYAS